MIEVYGLPYVISDKFGSQFFPNSAFRGSLSGNFGGSHRNFSDADSKWTIKGSTSVEQKALVTFSFLVRIDEKENCSKNVSATTSIPRV